MASTLNHHFLLKDHVRVVGSDYNATQNLYQPFFFFFLRIQTQRSISLKGKKTTKSLDTQKELYHQGWNQSTPGAHYQI